MAQSLVALIRGLLSFAMITNQRNYIVVELLGRYRGSVKIFVCGILFPSRSHIFVKPAVRSVLTGLLSFIHLPPPRN